MKPGTRQASRMAQTALALLPLVGMLSGLSGPGRSSSTKATKTRRTTSEPGEASETSRSTAHTSEAKTLPNRLPRTSEGTSRGWVRSTGSCKRKSKPGSKNTSTYATTSRRSGRSLRRSTRRSARRSRSRTRSQDIPCAQLLAKFYPSAMAAVASLDGVDELLLDDIYSTNERVCERIRVVAGKTRMRYCKSEVVVTLVELPCGTNLVVKTSSARREAFAPGGAAMGDSEAFAGKLHLANGSVYAPLAKLVHACGHVTQISALAGVSLEDKDWQAKFVAMPPLARALEIDRVAQQLTAAIAILQAHGMGHFDIKPDNIAVRVDNQGKTWYSLIDFGTSSKLDRSDAVPIHTDGFHDPALNKVGYDNMCTMDAHRLYTGATTDLCGVGIVCIDMAMWPMRLHSLVCNTPCSDADARDPGPYGFLARSTALWAGVAAGMPTQAHIDAAQELLALIGPGLVAFVRACVNPDPEQRPPNCAAAAAIYPALAAGVLRHLQHLFATAPRVGESRQAVVNSLASALAELPAAGEAGAAGEQLQVSFACEPQLHPAQAGGSGAQALGASIRSQQLAAAVAIKAVAEQQALAACRAAQADAAAALAQAKQARADAQQAHCWAAAEWQAKEAACAALQAQQQCWADAAAAQQLAHEQQLGQLCEQLASERAAKLAAEGAAKLAAEQAAKLAAELADAKQQAAELQAQLAANTSTQQQQQLPAQAPATQQLLHELAGAEQHTAEQHTQLQRSMGCQQPQQAAKPQARAQLAGTAAGAAKPKPAAVEPQLPGAVACAPAACSPAPAKQPGTPTRSSADGDLACRSASSSSSSHSSSGGSSSGAGKANARTCSSSSSAGLGGFVAPTAAGLPAQVRLRGRSAHRDAKCRRRAHKQR